MSQKVTFIIEKGDLSGQRFIFSDNETLVIGRQGRCNIVLTDSTVSGKHCIIEIQPATSPDAPYPTVLVKDCGSLNGTYINGKKISHSQLEENSKKNDNRHPDNTADEPGEIAFPLNNGDLLSLGKSCQMRLELKESHFCTICGCDVEDINYRTPDGTPICNTCHSNPEKVLNYLIKRR